MMDEIPIIIEEKGAQFGAPWRKGNAGWND